MSRFEPSLSAPPLGGLSLPRLRLPALGGPPLPRLRLRQPSVEVRALLAVAVACALWGLSLPFGKIALGELRPAHVVGVRFVLALVVLLPLTLRRRRPIARADVPLFAVGSALMVPATFLLQFEGLARTSATSAALLIGMMPPLLALAAVLFDGERLRAQTWCAVALTTLGALLMAGTPGAGRTVLGDALVCASVVTSVAWVHVTQRLMQRYSSLVVTTYCMAGGTLLLLPFLLLGPAPALPSPDGWGALILLGLVCTAATYTLWTWGLRYVPAARAGVFINLEPLVGAALGVVLLHETVATGTIVGGACVLVAAAFVGTAEPAPTPRPVRRRRKRRPAARHSRHR